MQRSQIKRKYCSTCKAKTKHERHVTAQGCGDLLFVVCTLGIWYLLRKIMTPGFRCAECGAKN